MIFNRNNNEPVPKFFHIREASFITIGKKRLSQLPFHAD